MTCIMKNLKQRFGVVDLQTLREVVTFSISISCLKQYYFELTFEDV